ncbi:MAG TPA: hypothetical protein VK272_14450 [Solirubrobacteraceae bacterium]|nr:hypothetical protein [Solirubrobacteraceae bacterium]
MTDAGQFEREPGHTVAQMAIASASVQAFLDTSPAPKQVLGDA